MAELSKAKTLLLAVSVIVDGNIAALRNLVAANPRTLHLELVLRLLLSALPESTEPSTYTPFLQELVSGSVEAEALSDVDIDYSVIEDLDEVEARARVRNIRLLPLLPTRSLPGQPADPLSLFLIHRARRIDAQTGVLTLLPELLLPFLGHSPTLRTWFISTLLPLLRYNYEYYPEEGTALSLLEFESLRGRSAVELLLSRTGKTTNGVLGEIDTVGRDLRGLVGPWLYRSEEQEVDEPTTTFGATDKPDEGLHGNHASDGRTWLDVFDWLLSNAPTRFPLVVQGVDQWDGPDDVDLGGYEDDHLPPDSTSRERYKLQYGRTALAAVYTAPDASIETLAGAHRIIVRVASLLCKHPPPDLASSASSLLPMDTALDLIAEASAMSLLPSALSQSSNLLTAPKESSVVFLHHVILSSYLLVRLGHRSDIRSTATLALSANGPEQQKELQRFIHNISNGPKMQDKDWARVHREVIWIWRWGVPEEAQTAAGVFGSVGREILEKEFLRLLLANARYQLVIDLYLGVSDAEGYLSRAEVAQAVLECAMGLYDNASNCNRTRGGVKKASDLIDAFFFSQFPDSAPFQRAIKLLKATHSLSFYSLKLHHGLPFQPVNIRAHQDPISLIGKVLEQNSRSYTKLDDLHDMGRNLVEAGLTSSRRDGAVVDISEEGRQEQLHLAERRITGMAIEAALAEEDFETAYSYVLNRISPELVQSRMLPPSSDVMVVSSMSQGALQDDTSWRAAFQAGRFRPTRHLARTSTGFANPEIRAQEMRMELLSQALLLAPQSALPEILGVWRRCEEELNVLLAQETEEKISWDEQGDRKVPGQFVSSSPATSRREGGRLGTGGEAPVGLFDVARGAAAALRKSAFPLQGPGATGRGASERPDAGSRPLSGVSADGSENGSLGGSEERLRKRDMVSSMVTGGLASGIGWVIGAPPAHGQAKE